MAQPAAFLFDMDGLLLDTERLYRDAFCDTTRAHAIETHEDAAFFNTLVGSSWAVTKAALQAYLPDDVMLAKFVDTWEDAARAQLAAGVPVKDTVRDVLEALSVQGATLAVVTSSKTDHARENLDRAGLLDMFSGIKGGDAVSATKPDPAPYLEMAADLGVSASDCYAFEDSDKGLTSAIRAGCRVVQIPDLRPPGIPFPDLGQHIADDLAAAMRHLGVL